MNPRDEDLLEFGPFRLDPKGRLSRGGETVVISTKKKEEQALTGKPFEVLLTLVSRYDRVVTKRDLEFEVWGGDEISENVLTQHVMTVRKFLGDSAKAPEYIERVPKKGYRFKKPVVRVPREAAGAIKTKEDKEAEELFNSGRESLYKFTTETELKKAVKCFEQAYDHRPDYAAAFAGAAEAHIWGSIFSWEEPGPTLAEAKRLAEKAHKLDLKLGDAEAVLALAELLLRWNWTGARDTFEQVLEQNPTSQPALRGYALWLMANGRFDDARRKVDRALALSSTSFLNIGIMCMLLYVSGASLDPFNEPRVYEFMKHVTDEHRKLKVDTAWYVLALFYERLGQYEKAIEVMKELELTEEQFLGHLVLAHIYAIAGHREEATKLLDRLKGLQRWVSPFHIALIELGLGNREEAKRFLDEAIKSHDPWACVLIDPRLTCLRDDPEFLEMFRRVNLDPELLRKFERIDIENSDGDKN